MTHSPGTDIYDYLSAVVADAPTMKEANLRSAHVVDTWADTRLVNRRTRHQTIADALEAATMDADWSDRIEYVTDDEADAYSVAEQAEQDAADRDLYPFEA